MTHSRLPIPSNHRSSLDSNDSPLYLPNNKLDSLSRRDFLKLTSAAAAAGIALPYITQPAAAQSMTSTERELLLMAIDAARDAGAD